MKSRILMCITAMALFAALAIPPRLAAQRQTYTVLHSFAGPPTDGSNPFDFGSLVRDSAGNLYGTAFAGGASNNGVVFKLDDHTRKQTVLHSFTGSPTDGAAPAAGLIRDKAGNLYGTTTSGGTTGYGVVFKVDPSGMETVLYSFTGGADGANPQAGLARDSAGNLYGTTSSGGTSGNGVGFTLDPTGKETVIYSFTGGANGALPYARLVRDLAGNLYGTTISGGTTGNGVVFKLDPTGNETVLYSFTGGTDGRAPVAGLVRDPAGNLYGTTTIGGDLSAFGGLGCGVVFKLDSTGKETVLYSFTGGADGCQPFAGLVRDAAGNLYGATESGGNSNFGVVFKLDITGKETVLHTFTGPDGLQVDAGLVRDAKGNLYGTTVGSGASGYGVVFKLTPCDEDRANPEGCGDRVESTAVAFIRTPQVPLGKTAVTSAPTATLSPTSLTFSTQAIGTTSVAKSVTLKNTGTTSLTINSIAITGTNAGDFAQTNACGISLAAGASCSISVTFKPTSSGTRTAALSITDNAAGSPQKVALSGIGVNGGTLTGSCIVPVGNQCAGGKPLFGCPTGQPVITPGFVGCGFGPLHHDVPVDTSRRCRIPNLSLSGYCIRTVP